MFTFGPGYQANQAAALASYYSGKELRVYGGTAPANAKASIGSATLLVTHEEIGTFTAAATSISLGATDPAEIAEGGEASFIRIYDGSTCELQGIVGEDVTYTPDADLIAGNPNNVTGLTINIPSE